MNAFNHFGVRNAPLFRALAGLQAAGLQESAHGSVGNQDVTLRQSLFECLHTPPEKSGVRSQNEPHSVLYPLDNLQVRRFPLEMHSVTQVGVMNQKVSSQKQSPRSAVF